MNILDKIIAHKKEEIKKNKKQHNGASLLRMIEERPHTRSFAGAINHPETVTIIAEVKKASPSAGIIRQDFDPVAIAKSYGAHGAGAISILTDETFFQGKLSYIAEARGHVDVPILRKDFIIDPYQVIEARAHGADAILLIMAALSKKQCRELKDAADECDLDVLAETHNAGEVETALEMGFPVIGINNRDLTTFHVDLRTTEKLMQRIPPAVTVVSESGIKNRDDIHTLGEMGADAVLIGETFMRRQDTGAAVEAFTGVRKWSR